MSSQIDATDRADSRDEDESAGEHATPSSMLICWQCQRPLDPVASVRIDGEPVHPTCHVESRCGVSLFGPHGAPTPSTPRLPTRGVGGRCDGDDEDRGV